MSYYEVCIKINKNGWKVDYNDEQKVKYAYSNDQWVGYDDIETLKYKLDFAKQFNLGGIMVWSLDLDDFSGEHCNQGKYPLLNFIRKEVLGDQPTIELETDQSNSTVTTTTKSTSTWATRLASAVSKVASTNNQHHNRPTDSRMIATTTKGYYTPTPFNFVSNPNMVNSATSEQPPNFPIFQPKPIAPKCPNGDGYCK